MRACRTRSCRLPVLLLRSRTFPRLSRRRDPRPRDVARPMRRRSQRAPLSPRRPDRNVVDSPLDGEAQSTQLREPCVAIVVVNDSEHADHARGHVASNRRASPLVAPVDDVSGTIHGSVHAIRSPEAPGSNPNLDQPPSYCQSAHALNEGGSHCVVNPSRR